jgi:hypothetical protein
MGEDFEPIADQADKPVGPPSHERILWLMATIGMGGAIIGSAFGSLRLGLGILIGTALAFANYYWLKSSLRRIFSAAERGDRPRMLGLKYFLRYVVLAAVVGVFYIADWVSMIGLILGLGAFGFAVVADGLIRIFQGPAAVPPA